MADLGPQSELIDVLAAGSLGVTIRPVQKGSRQGGFGSDYRYEFDGWEVGWIGGGMGSELAVGVTIAEAVTEALRAVERGEF